jgi:hypothetical protein
MKQYLIICAVALTLIVGAAFTIKSVFIPPPPSSSSASTDPADALPSDDLLASPPPLNQEPLPLNNELLPPATTCARAGCSGQLCVDASFGLDNGSVITTCEWREEFACYQAATCEVQDNGRCGFTVTPELTSCLDDVGVATPILAPISAPLPTRAPVAPL